MKNLLNLQRICKRDRSNHHSDRRCQSGTKDADVIYTDVWVSMGEPDEVWEERIHELSPYKGNKEVMEMQEKGNLPSLSAGIP